MKSDSIEEMFEVGDLYWRHRVGALEGLVAELLEKNQNMRFVLQAMEHERPKAGASEIKLAPNKMGSSLQL